MAYPLGDPGPGLLMPSWDPALHPRILHPPGSLVVSAGRVTLVSWGKTPPEGPDGSVHGTELPQAPWFRTAVTLKSSFNFFI